MIAIRCLFNHGFSIELLLCSCTSALFLNSINDHPIYHLLPQKQSALSCLIARTSVKKWGQAPILEKMGRKWGQAPILQTPILEM